MARNTRERRFRSATARTRGGFTLIETCIAVGVMTIAMVCFSSVVASSSRMGADTRQASIAGHAARSVLESMRCRPFELVARLYDSDPSNDPDGPGTAPGRWFAVAGLDLAPNDDDGFVGEVILPEVELQIREDSTDERLGMPRDLDGDTVIDDVDHGSDYRLLPVLVRIQWKGPRGERTLEMFTMLAAMEVVE
jgi:type II secretory pathway pseudopilin PulG